MHAERLARFARDAYARGWAVATSGNFSAVVSHDPLRLAITASGRHKGELTASDVVEVGADGEALAGAVRPSAETPIHLAIARARSAGAVAHVHSVWATIVSERFAAAGAVELAGLEMLKAFDGVATHDHREVVPIVENTQAWAAAAPAIEDLLRRHRAAHGFLIRGHGLYTWGRDLDEAWRHLEAFEFLFEVVARRGA
jgi:methylthioribulose-1-phosphate dehydratase